MRILFFTVLLLNCWCYNAGANIRVCPGCDHSSIEKGLATAHANDTVFIERGTYYETGLVIDKPLTIIGRDWPVIDAEGGPGVLTITSDKVCVSGIEIRNIGTSYVEDHAAIRVIKSRNFILENNRIMNGFFGIYLENCSDGIVRDNQLVGEAVEEMSSGNALHLWYCKRMKIENNQVSGHRDGIYLEFVDEASISGNISKNNLRYGLHFMFSNDDEYYNNRFEANGAGVAVMFSKNIDMSNNEFIRNWGKASYGLLLKEIYDARINNNSFNSNSIGIYVEGSTRIAYENNTFERNGWAIKMSGGCLDNVVTKNDFLENSFDLSISQNINENKFDGNYWSAYTGYDLNRDGTGDVPYRPVKLFNFIVDRTPETLVLLRSLFVDMINFAEKVSPVFTPENVTDAFPRMKTNRTCR